MDKYPHNTFEMELPDRPGPKIHHRRPWRCIGVIVAIVVLVAIIVPLAVVLPRRNNSSAPSRVSTAQKSSVIVPLYINPNTNGWDPLYNAISQTPTVNYSIVINPSNGPGPSALPDSNYVSAIKKLSTSSNVRIIGYVHTSYGTRNIDDVLADIAVYGNWSSKSSGLYVDGIFFDEAPHIYSIGNNLYLNRVDLAVKENSGIQKEKTVIHNQGVVPQAGLNSTNCDITIAFEESYATYQTLQSSLSALNAGRSHYGFIMHSVPSSVDLFDLVVDMAQKASYLFITNLDKNYYESFGSNWSDFTKAMPT